MKFYHSITVGAAQSIVSQVLPVDDSSAQTGIHEIGLAATSPDLHTLVVNPSSAQTGIRDIGLEATSPDLHTLVVNPSSAQTGIRDIGLEATSPDLHTLVVNASSAQTGIRDIGLEATSPDQHTLVVNPSSAQTGIRDVGLEATSPDLHTLVVNASSAQTGIRDIGLAASSPDQHTLVVNPSSAQTGIRDVGLAASSPDLHTIVVNASSAQAGVLDIGLFPAPPPAHQLTVNVSSSQTGIADIGLDPGAPLTTDPAILLTNTTPGEEHFLQKWTTESGTGPGTPLGYYPDDINGTLMFWMKSNNQNGLPQTIWSVGNGGTDRVKVYVQGDGITDDFVGVETDGSGQGTNDFQYAVSIPILDNATHFIAVRAQPGSYDIFVDGVKNPLSADGTSGDNSGAWLALQKLAGNLLAERVNIGGFQTPAEDVYTGTLDELVHVRSALSDEEIVALYNAGAGYLIDEIEANADWWTDAVGAAYKLDTPNVPYDDTYVWPDHHGNEYPMSLVRVGSAMPDSALALVTGGYTPVNNFWDSFTSLIHRWEFGDATTLRGTAAALFTAANAAYLQSSGATAMGTYPMTICGWAKRSSDVAQAYACISTDGSVAYLEVGSSGTNVYCRSQGAGTVALAASGTAIGEWGFFGARFGASNDRKVWGNVATSTNTQSEIVSSRSKLTLGARWSNSVASDFADAEIDYPYVWNAALTDAQVEWVRDNKPTYSVLETSTHPDNPGVANLASVHPLNEAEGTRQDLGPNAQHLAQIGDVDSGVGHIEEVVGVEDRAINVDNNGALQNLSELEGDVLPNGDHTVVIWYGRETSDNTVSAYFSLGETADNAYQSLELNASNAIRYRHDSDTAAILNVTLSGPYGTGTHMVVYRYTAAGPLREVIADGDTGNIASSGSVAPIWPSKQISVGKRTTGGATYVGDIDEVMIFHSALSNQAVIDLWNSGIGILASDIIDDEETIDGNVKPAHAWPLNDNTGWGMDIGTVGGRTLTEVATVTDVPGIPAGRVVPGSVLRAIDQHASADALQPLQGKRPELINVMAGTVSLQPVMYDGVDDALDASGTHFQQQPLTAIAVLRPLTPTGGVQGIVSATPGFRVGTSDERQLNAGLNLQAGTIANRETWVGIVDGGSSDFYVSTGEQAIGNAGSTDLTDPLQIGGGSSANFQIMELYHVSYYAGVLSLAEINAIGQKLDTDYLVGWTDKT